MRPEPPVDLGITGQKTLEFLDRHRLGGDGKRATDPPAVQLLRLGFTQGNEWSDHVTENINYLYLAPSKLRTCSIGPELVTDLAFDDVRGRCRILRGGTAIYDSGELYTGERNMSHSLVNIEDHHFKYLSHRQPGDIHVHFFGTSKLSFQQRNWTYQNGDLIEVAFAGLGAPLYNPVLRHEPSSSPVRVDLG
jgi:hypothetical protein